MRLYLSNNYSSFHDFVILCFSAVLHRFGRATCLHFINPYLVLCLLYCNTSVVHVCIFMNVLLYYGDD